MSALDRGSRSRSRPPTTSVDPALADNTNHTATSTSTTTRTLTPQPEALTPRTTLPDHEPIIPQKDSMISTLQATELSNGFDRPSGAIEAARAQLGRLNDSRSSSLSEPIDGPSDGEDAIRATYTLAAPDENDSEAETERLHDTPRKLTRTATDVTVGSETATGRTPSMLRRQLVADRESSESEPPSERMRQGGATMDEVEALSGLSALAAAATEPAVVETANLSPRKRKRSTPDASPISDEEAEEPARKRSGSSRVNGGSGALDTAEERIAVEEDNADDVRALGDQKDEGMVDIVGAAQELEEDEPALAKSSKAKKGKRKGKKAKEPDITHRSIESVPPVAVERQPDAEVDDEPVAVGEELNKKRNAMDSLEEIQRQFVLMRSRLTDERISQLDGELEALRQPNSNHPEYLAMLRCIDERLAEKKQVEDMTLRYKMGALGNRIVCERRQLQSQYFQTVRDLRDDFLYLCNKTFLKLRQERNLFGADDPDYTYKYNPDRAEQVKRQTAYNKEVSILSGVAKYVGFPAAPDLNGARPNELDQDLRAMRINPQPAPLHPLNRPYPQPDLSVRDRQAAESQFLAETPWANPQHPLTQANSHNAFHSVPSSAHPPRFTSAGSGNLFTPAPQKGRINTQALTGSAVSTATAPETGRSDSRPAAAQGTPATLRMEDTVVSETPSLGAGQGKRGSEAGRAGGAANEEQQQQQQNEEGGQRSPRSLPQQLNAFAIQRSEQRFMARSPFAAAAAASPGLAQAAAGERVPVFRR